MSDKPEDESANILPGEVEWSFQKYLVDRSGKVVALYHHRTKPLTPEVVAGC